MRKPLIFFLGFLSLLPAAVVGAGAGAEVTLAVGSWGGDTSFPIEAGSSALILCVTTPCLLAEATTEERQLDSLLLVDVPLSDQWMIEGLLTRQNGLLRLRSFPELPFPAFDGYLDRETFKTKAFQVGLLRQWREGRWRPFATGALGVTTFESSALVYDRPFFPGIIARPVDEEVLSASLAGGVKADLGRHLALRLEGRFYWHDLPDRLGGTLRQTQTSLGLAYRW